MNVPLLDLKAQYDQLRDEIQDAIHRVLESQQFILGPEVGALEKELAAHCDATHVVACASGSDALLLSLAALEVGPGDEVICPSYTFFATAGAIHRLGATPVFVDIEPTTYNLDPQALRARAASCSSLKAIVPVDLFGQIADLDACREVASERGVAVVEDAAQAIGAHDASGARAGSRTELGCFSFFPSKNLGAYGDAGFISTQDDGLAEVLRVLRVHGSKPKYFHRVVGMNSRMDAIQAAIVRVKLRYLEAWSERRRENAARYDAAFGAEGAGVSGGPEGSLALRTPQPCRAPASHIYNQYVLRVPDRLRDPLRDHLREAGIGSEVYYPLGLHQQECFASLGYEAGALPETEAAARETLAIPVYPELRAEQMDHVVATVVGFVRNA